MPRYSLRTVRSKRESSVGDSSDAKNGNSATMGSNRPSRKSKRLASSGEIPLIDLSDNDSDDDQESNVKQKSSGKSKKTPQRNATKRSYSSSTPRNNKKRRTTGSKANGKQVTQSDDDVMELDALNSPRAKRDSTRNSSKSSASMSQMTTPKQTPKSPRGKQTVSAKKSASKMYESEDETDEEQVPPPRSTRSSRSSSRKVQSVKAEDTENTRTKESRNSKTPTTLRSKRISLTANKIAGSSKTKATPTKSVAKTKQNVSKKTSSIPNKSTPSPLRLSKRQRQISKLKNVETKVKQTPKKRSVSSTRKRSLSAGKKPAQKKSRTPSKTTPKNKKLNTARGRPSRKRKASDDGVNKDAIKGEAFVKIQKLEMESEDEEESPTEESTEESNNLNDATEVATAEVESEVKEESNTEVKEESNPEVKEKSNPEVKEKSNPEVKEKSNPEVKEKSNPEVADLKEEVAEVVSAPDSETANEVAIVKDTDIMMDIDAENLIDNDAACIKEEENEKAEVDAKDEKASGDWKETPNKTDDVNSERKEIVEIDNEVDDVPASNVSVVNAKIDTNDADFVRDKERDLAEEKAEEKSLSESSEDTDDCEVEAEEPKETEKQDVKLDEVKIETLKDDDESVTNGGVQPSVDDGSELKYSGNEDKDVEVFSLTLDAKLLRRRVVSARRYLDTCENDRQPVSFVVVSYNLLGKDWSTNHQQLIDEILQLTPSILCLQDVSEIYFKHHLEPSLGKLDFKGIYASSEVEGRGLVTFVKATFEIIDNNNYIVRDLIDKELQQLELVELEKEKLQSFLTSPGQALITVVKCKANDQMLTAVSVNLPTSEELELAVQTTAVIKKTLEFSDNEAYVLCGSFSLTEHTQINNYLKDGNLEMQTWQKLKEKSENMSSNKIYISVQHLIESCISDTSTKLQSAYNSVLGRELKLPHQETQTVKDSIWFGGDFLQEQTVYDVCSSSVLPDSSLDSHVSLQAELEFL